MKKVLWIDDDASLLNDCAPLFEQNGFYIFKAFTVTQALVMLREEASSIDGIIVDVKLGGGGEKRG